MALQAHRAQQEEQGPADLFHASFIKSSTSSDDHRSSKGILQSREGVGQGDPEQAEEAQAQPVNPEVAAEDLAGQEEVVGIFSLQQKSSLELESLKRKEATVQQEEMVEIHLRQVQQEQAQEGPADPEGQADSSSSSTPILMIGQDHAPMFPEGLALPAGQRALAPAAEMATLEIPERQAKRSSSTRMSDASNCVCKTILIRLGYI